MRIVASILFCTLLLLSSGCTVLEKETTNRGGYLDYVLDQHWFKADSKRMRALRAFSIQVSLARIASVSAKNESDRTVLAIRVGALTTQFLPVLACALKPDPITPGTETNPCFYYDSAMVEYSTGLFDLAMVALPIADAKNLINAISGSTINPVAFADLLRALLVIGRDALNYGRIVGGLYRDTIELEVQLWLATPAIDDRPPPYRVTEAEVAPLREIYARGNDDMPAWIAAMAALRNAGLEPLPDPRFFVELNGLLNYICDQITKNPAVTKQCKTSFPPVLMTPATAGGTAVPVHVSVNTQISPVQPGRSKAPSGEMKENKNTQAGGVTPQCPVSATLQDAIKAVRLRQQIINGTATVLANPSASSFGAKTVSDGGNAMVAALICISAQLQQASDLTAAQQQKDEYQKVRNQIANHVNALRGIVDALNSAAANRDTVVNAAGQISLRLAGVQGLTGVNVTVDHALQLLEAGG